MRRIEIQQKNIEEMYEKTKSQIISETQYTEDDISFKEFSHPTDGPKEGFHRELVKNTTLTSPRHDEKIRKFIDNDGNLIAKCKFLQFHTEYKAYIKWLEVVPEGNGIGKQLRKEMIDEIGDKYTIYSNITTEKLYSVARRHGFEQIDNGELEGWFVRK